MLQLLLKYGITQDDTFSHVLAYNALEDRTREPFFREILGDDRLIAYSSFPEFSQILKTLKPHILHHYSAGIPEFPCLAMNKDYVKHWIQTSVFGQQNNQVPFERVIYVSKHVQHMAGTFGDQYCVVRNPIEAPFTDEDLREELGIPNDMFVFGMISGGREETHASINMDAYQKVESNSTCLVIVNPTPSARADSDRLQLRNTIFVDKTADDIRLSKFFNTCDVLIHARKDGECNSAVLWDASAHGKPIVSHYGNPFNGHIETIGTGGFVVAPEDVIEYERIMRGLMDGEIDYTKVGENGRRHWEETCKAEDIAKLQLDIYKEL